MCYQWCSSELCLGLPVVSCLCQLSLFLHQKYGKCMFFADDLKIYLNLRYQSCTSLALDFSSCQHDIDSVGMAAEQQSPGV